jgi:hypothetical protein
MAPAAIPAAIWVGLSFMGRSFGSGLIPSLVSVFFHDGSGWDSRVPLGTN